MPLYEYRCSKCGDKFEVIQKFADEPLTVHPDCGGPVERLISAPGLHFKGSGWYITDYARGGAKTSESKPAESKSDSKSAESKSTESGASETKSTETKSESKPAGASPKTD